MPDSFVRRPVVLIRPDAQMSANAEQASPPLSLTVCRNDEFLDRIDGSKYRGQTVWTGCHVDVEIPLIIRERWQLEIAKLGQRPEILTRWTAPLAVGADIELRAGDRLTATLFKPDGTPYGTGNVEVKQIHPGEAFAQELHLDYVDDEQFKLIAVSCPRG